MSMRSGASVCQLLAVSSVPRGARTLREGSCWVNPADVRYLQLGLGGQLGVCGPVAMPGRPMSGRSRVGSGADVLPSWASGQASRAAATSLPMRVDLPPGRVR